MIIAVTLLFQCPNSSESCRTGLSAASMPCRSPSKRSGTGGENIASRTDSVSLGPEKIFESQFILLIYVVQLQLDIRNDVDILSQK